MIFENDEEQALFEQFKEWRKEHGEKKGFDYYIPGKNPYAKESLNMTAQQEILGRNPAKALQLAREAGNLSSVRAIQAYLEGK